MKLILELDDTQLYTGYVRVVMGEEKGDRAGVITISDFAEFCARVFRWDTSSRGVRMISRFDDSPYLAFGRNGARWQAVKEIPPGEYYLVSVSGQAFQVRLPRLIAKVGSHTSTFLYWTDAERLAPTTQVYPLMIGNIDARGWVCLGTSGLKCKSPEDIDQYVRQVIEVPVTGTYLSAKTKVDKLFAQLAKGWAPGIGRKHGRTLASLLADQER